MAHQADAAWTGTKLADIENEDIKVHYVSKKAPRKSCQKMARAQVVDAGFLMKKGMECVCV